MELEEMRSLWTEMSADVDKQKKNNSIADTEYDTG